MSYKKNKGAQIIELVEQGFDNKTIATQLQCTSSAVSYYRRQLDVPVKSAINWIDAQTDYDNGDTLKLVCQKYNVTPTTALKYLKTRSLSDAQKLSRASRPARTHTIPTKDKMSEAMYVRRRNGYNKVFGQNPAEKGLSYPEQFFKNIIETHFIDKNYTQQFRIKRYSLDFAWLDKKRVIEIDGEQHYQFETSIQRDIKRDEYLTQQGWSILRIRWKLFKKDPKKWIFISKQFIDGE